LRTVVVRSW